MGHHCGFCTCQFEVRGKKYTVETTASHWEVRPFHLDQVLECPPDEVSPLADQPSFERLGDGEASNKRHKYTWHAEVGAPFPRPLVISKWESLFVQVDARLTLMYMYDQPIGVVRHAARMVFHAKIGNDVFRFQVNSKDILIRDSNVQHHVDDKRREVLERMGPRFRAARTSTRL